MPSQKQYDTTLQPYRNIKIRISVLDYQMDILDEISGVATNASISVDADSDIRRTANISMIIKSVYTKTVSVGVSGYVANLYWTAGNPYWFDKFIKIEVAIQDIKTQDYIWVNQGIFMIDSPSIEYDSTTNELNFQAVDLMCKLTGQRNGYLEGMTYTIPVNSSITGAIEGILLEQGFTKYILLNPPQSTTPYDVNVDSGGTAYELLAQLRDINANWEMFFDTEGVFHFQEIPSGKVLINPTTGETGEPSPLIDNTIWDKLYVKYDLDTNFSEVKNYIEVYGGTFTPNLMIDNVAVSASRINLTLDITYDEFIKTYGDYVIIGFGLNINEESTMPILRSSALDKISLILTDKTINFTGNDYEIWYDNEYYECLFKLVDSQYSDRNNEYLGFLQPTAIAFEDNPNSPFYVGDVIQYTCGLGTAVNFASDSQAFIIALNMGMQDGESTMGTLDVRPYLNDSDFDNALVGTEWVFKIALTKDYDNIDTIDITYSNNITTNEYILQSLGSENHISLDFNGDYLIHIVKATTNSISVYAEYYPIPAYNFETPTDKIWNVPKFRNQVRYVCSGDEYDNIYSNDLAKQRASYEIYLRSRLHDEISITTVPIYWLDVNQIIEFNLPNSDEDAHDLWLVKSISTDLSVDGEQTINAMRYYPLYKPQYTKSSYLLDSDGKYLREKEGSRLSVYEE